MCVALIISILLTAPVLLVSPVPSSNVSTKKNMKKTIPGWRLRAPLEDYERGGVSEVLPNGQTVPLDNPYLAEMERSMSIKLSTKNLEAYFGAPKAPRYPGSLVGTAHRNNTRLAGWWLEKVSESGEFEGVILFFLAGKTGDRPSLTMMAVTAEFYRRHGIPSGHSAGFIPGLKIATEGSRLVKKIIDN